MTRPRRVLTMRRMNFALRIFSLAVCAVSCATAQTNTITNTNGLVLPYRPQTILPADRVTPRRAELAKLRAAEAAGDLATAARINADLAYESWSRGLRVAKAWEVLRDPETKLVPRDQKDPLWNGEDVASDCWPFLFLASRELNPSRADWWMETLASDRALGGVLPKVIRFNPTRVSETPMNKQLFGGAEYIKDGLVFLTEQLGRGPWFDRMDEIALALVTNAIEPTKRGLIAGPDSEINGDMLLLLPRMYWITKNPKYLEMAQRVADVYILDVFPVSGGMPPLYWDFVRNQRTSHPNSLRVKYRDHGNETIFGLTELYFLEQRLGLEAAQRHREPIRAMLDKMLTFGRTPDGLWCNLTDLHKGGHANGVGDNWGYLLNALHTFDLTEGTFRYTLEIQRTMLAAAKMKSYPWEKFPMDGYADSIESMMYMMPWFDLPEARAWVDDEIEILFSFQRPEGFIEAQYLDGNFVRTCLLYGRYKTQGIAPAPWRDDLRIGAIRDPKTRGLVVHASSATAWNGVLKFDAQRHKEIWGMTDNYPRLNAPPEWYAIPATAKFTVTINGGAPREVTGTELTTGLPITLAAGTAQTLTVTPVN